MPRTEEALSKATDETKRTLSTASATVAEAAKATAADLTAKFMTMAKAEGDNVLQSIGEDLAARAKSLVESAGGSQTIKTNVESTLTALLNGSDAEALAPAFQLAQGAGLTEGQIQLAKEVGDLASAFVVQRNFSSLSGAQGDVATLVNSLRNGEYATALAPLQKIMGNASLTTSQKDLLGDLADKYAPSLKQAAGTLQEGLKSLQGLPGMKK